MQPRRDFHLLLAGQFLGAFGDNFLLAAILGPLTYALESGRITTRELDADNAVLSAVFFVPYIVLAPLAGFLNDRMPKTWWLVGGNLTKLVGAAIGMAGASLSAAHGQGWQAAGYAVVGAGACVYSPAKYGVLPEILPEEALVRANGLVEMLTLVAIVLGLGGGAVLYDRIRSLAGCYAACLALYGGALVLNAAMARTPADRAARLGRSLAEFGTSLAGLVRHPRLGRILLGSGVFWFAGAVLRTNLQAWGLQVFREAGAGAATNTELAGLKVGLVLGAVAGAMLAGAFHRTGDLGWSRRYAWLLALAVALLGLLGGRWGIAAAAAALGAAGAFGGLLVVPLNAALQAECDPSRLGKTVAVQNFTDYFSMLVGAGFLAALNGRGLSPAQDFVALAAAVAVLAFALRLGRRPPG